MATRVYLSPSDQWSNTVADKAHSEAHHCKQIAQAAEKYLKANGYTVKVGDNSKEGSYTKRVTDSNKWGADVHICIHTNAGGGKGTEVFCWFGKQKNKYVQAVYNRVAKLTPTSDRGIKSHAHLYEIKYTSATCVYIECEFHDNKTTENWIDSHIDAIGKAIARGVCDADGKTFKTGQSSSSANSAASGKAKYTVQVGAFTKKANANRQAKQLKADGFDAYVYKEGNYYKVQCGAFANKANAEALVKKLIAAGHSTYIKEK